MPDCGSQAPVRRITVKINQSDYSICNRMESVAAEAISQVLLDEVDGCRCPLCQEDMQCYLLNQLEPLYVPVLSEDIGKEMSLQDLAPDLRRRVVSEAYRAVIVVWGSVRHGGERAILHNYTERVVLEALGEALAQEKLDLGREELSMLMADIMNDLPRAIPHRTKEMPLCARTSWFQRPLLEYTARSTTLCTGWLHPRLG